MYGLTPFENRTYNPFAVFNDFDRDFFGGKFPMDTCRTDVRDENDKYIVETELPGFEKEDINIDIDGNHLILSAEHKTENEDKVNGKYIHRERTYGSYRRSFDISEVNADRIEAEYKNGVLTMTLPKKSAEVPAAKRLVIK
ncbi:MAG: Hsp20/alpha crystallin family protein [Oscillospiraceae bacterium]